jgi:N-methylhydantoinase B
MERVIYQTTAAASFLLAVRRALADGEATVDLSESAGQLESFLNSSGANTCSAVYAAFMYLMGERVPANNGCLRPIRVVAPEGSIANPRPPAPVGACTTHVGSEIVEAVPLALARPSRTGLGRFCPAVPLQHQRTRCAPRPALRLAPVLRAWWGWRVGLCRWLVQLGCDYQSRWRAPPRHRADGAAISLLHPALRVSTGLRGAGKQRGGLGSVLEMQLEGDEPATINTSGDGVEVPPAGLFGGQPGQSHYFRLISVDEERQVPSKATGIPFRPRNILRNHSAGGGGYGDSRERGLSLITQDLGNGVVTCTAARDIYERGSDLESCDEPSEGS